MCPVNVRNTGSDANSCALGLSCAKAHIQIQPVPIAPETYSYQSPVRVQDVVPVSRGIHEGVMNGGKQGFHGEGAHVVHPGYVLPHKGKALVKEHLGSFLEAS